MFDICIITFDSTFVKLFFFILRTLFYNSNCPINGTDAAIFLLDIINISVII